MSGIFKPVPMAGTILNAAFIVAGGVAGLVLRRSLAAPTQQFLKIALGMFTVWVGLRLAVSSLSGGLWPVLKQLLVAILAMILGRLLGRLLRVQRGLNHLGQFASHKLAQARPGRRPSPGDVFLATAVLFCAAPLAVLGPVPESLRGDVQPLLLKAVMDGLVALALAPTLRWPVLLAVLPMAAVQLSIARAAQWCEPTLRAHSLLDPVTLVCGLLIFCLSLIILALRKVEVGDYLPALLIAPCLSWLWR